MHRPIRAALFAAVCFGLVQPSAALAHDAVDRARSLLAKNDPKAAVTILEEALPKAGADLGPIIVALRQAYTRAADQTSKAGRTDEAEAYRENLQILNRQMRGKTEQPEPNPVDKPESVKVPEPTPIEKSEPDPSAVPVASAPTRDEPTPVPLQPLLIEPPTSQTPSKVVQEAKPSTALEMPTSEAGPDPREILDAADRAYLSEHYLDAAKSYAELAKLGELPPERKIHWAYCRSVDVVRRIKAKPTSAADWAAIDREIVEIKTLSPRYWYAEYLRNRVADQSRVAVRMARGQVIRGAMPETERPAEAIRDLTRQAPAVEAQPPVTRIGKPGAIVLALPSTETPQAISSHREAGRWQIKETPNFVIFHADPVLAEMVAKQAESARETQTRRWTGSPPPRAWTPRCEVYLYPTAAIFAQVTQQPITSEGFSTIASDGQRTTVRRINLRADHPTVVSAVLPHEVTHVILADLFPTQQPPRWADEGIAVLSEPSDEQERRIGDLDLALNGGKIFSIENLMVRDYPDGPHWALYYAQSISLTRFLVDSGTPGQFIDFLQGTQRTDVETELRRVYRIDGFADLQKRWLDYAKVRVATKSEVTRR